MIVTTITVVAKVYGSKATQSTANELQSKVLLDPNITGYDMVVIDPSAMSGIKGSRLYKALCQRNANVSLLVLAEREDQLKQAKNIPNVKTAVVSFRDQEKVKDTVDSFLEKEVADVDMKFETVEQPVIQPVQTIPVETPVLPYQPEQTQEQMQPLQPQMVVQEEELPKTEETPATSMERPLEERIRDLNPFASSLAKFREYIKKTEITSDIIRENSRYASALQMFDLLDKEIVNIANDTSLYPEEKMAKLKEKILTRIGYKEQLNNILVEKAYQVILAAVATAQDSMQKYAISLDDRLGHVEAKNLLYANQDDLNATIRERQSLIMDIIEAKAKLTEILGMLHDSQKEIAEELNADIPATSPRINEIFKHDPTLTMTENAGELLIKLGQALHKGDISFSAIENQLQTYITSINTLCLRDKTEIEMVRSMCDIMTAQRVEDVVIVDSLLKNCLRAFIGPEYVGTRTTAITWAGMMSRRQNTLIIDLTGDNKFANYGIQAVPLEEFMVERIQRPLMAVYGNVDTIDGLHEVVAELKTRLSYYPYITFIFTSAQIDLLNSIVSDTLVVHFVTDGSTRSMAIMKNVISRFEDGNIAKKLVITRSSVDPHRVVSEIGIDPMTTKLICIPYMEEMQTMELLKKQPHENNSILTVFEEAFR